MAVARSTLAKHRMERFDQRDCTLWLRQVRCKQFCVVNGIRVLCGLMFSVRFFCGWSFQWRHVILERVVVPTGYVHGGCFPKLLMIWRYSSPNMTRRVDRHIRVAVGDHSRIDCGSCGKAWLFPSPLRSELSIDACREENYVSKRIHNEIDIGFKTSGLHATYP